MYRVMTITEDGLMLGAGTVLAKMDRAAEPTTGLVLGAAAEERLLALLAAAYGPPVEGSVLGNIRRASQYWRDKQQHLAAIELALTGLPPLADEPGAFYRLYLADRLIDSGFAPREVAKVLGAGLALPDTARAGFNPNQPRVPAGNPDGGQWDNGNGVTAAPAAARNPPAAPEYRTGDPDKFFDTLYPPVHALAQRLGIDETWLLGLAAHESGSQPPRATTTTCAFSTRSPKQSVSPLTDLSNEESAPPTARSVPRNPLGCRYDPVSASGSQVPVSLARTSLVNALGQHQQITVGVLDKDLLLAGFASRFCARFRVGQGRSANSVPLICPGSSRYRGDRF